MSKYSKYQRPPFEKPSEQHPIWRGIGCLLAIILPLMSYAAAVLLVRHGLSHGWPIPPELTGYIEFKDWVWKTPLISNLARPIANCKDLWAVLITSIIILVFLSGIITTAYAIMRRITGPSQYSPVDVPPSQMGKR